MTVRDSRVTVRDSRVTVGQLQTDCQPAAAVIRTSDFQPMGKVGWTSLSAQITVNRLLTSRVLSA